VWRDADLWFDAGQYEAEVRRAAADRSWETPARAAGRHLTALLRAEPRLAALGYRLGWVAPHPETPGTFRVSVQDPGRRQVVVDLTAPEREPEEWAHDLAAAFLAAAPDGWDVTFRGGEQAAT
jgi:hypothetical protein